MLLLHLFKWGISLIKSNTWKFEANAMANCQAKCVSKYALYAYHDDDWWLYCKVNMYFIIKSLGGREHMMVKTKTKLPHQ